MPRCCRRREEGSDRPAMRTHFFKIIHSAIILDRQLPCSSSVLLITFLYELNLSNLQGIPRKFVRKFRNTLSDVAFLKVPSGKIWRVGLRKADGEVWFQNGWQEFMEYHSIHDGHFLVFRYDGNSHFHVLIFDMSACEIEYPFDTKKFEEPKKEISEEDFAETLDASPPCQTRRDGAPLPRLRSRMVTSTESIYETRNTYNLRALVPPFRHKGVQFSESQPTQSEKDNVEPHCSVRKSTRGHDFYFEQESQSLPSAKSCMHSNGFVTRRRPVTTHEIDRALQTARAFKSENPFFMVIMRKSYVNAQFILVSSYFIDHYATRKLLYIYNIPFCFAKRYFKGLQNVTLRVLDGRTWPVWCTYRNKNAKIYRGWKAYVQDNYLEEGDVCVFELIKRKHVELKVTIFRVV
ncbi:hypothetical protein HHK36_010006 [Tetracentron sinense]|uniref:TF-B3 domain-containing protein n=1 Tax=Tetracentron sinense TaxID=13715 RepID=A0A835DI28_TETSI|nr:hypothetical protein HHK36_010006 [Tetracentron sinense]